MLEAKWGVSARPQVIGQPGTPESIPDAVVEQTEFDVILAECSDAARIMVVREIRPIIGFGLKESMDFAKAVPKTMKTGVSRAEAEAIKTRVEAAGGVVEIK